MNKIKRERERKKEESVYDSYMGNVVSDYSLVQSSIFISFSPVWISAPGDSRSIQPGLRTSEA